MFGLVRTAFFSFCFNLYEMLDSDNNFKNYKTLEIIIGTIIKNSEILKFVPDYLRTKRMCKNAVRKLLFVLMCFPDPFKTQGMCDKVILENSGMLRFVPDCYKNKKMCEKAVYNYSHT